MPHASPLGVCVLPQRALNKARTVNYPNYIFEILNHAGLFHQALPLDQVEGALEEIGVLVTIGDAEVPASLRNKLAAWGRAGGAWLSIAGTFAMDELFGVTPEAPAMWSWGGGGGGVVRSLG